MEFLFPLNDSTLFSLIRYTNKTEVGKKSEQNSLEMLKFLHDSGLNEVMSELYKMISLFVTISAPLLKEVFLP